MVATKNTGLTADTDLVIADPICWPSYPAGARRLVQPEREKRYAVLALLE